MKSATAPGSSLVTVLLIYFPLQQAAGLLSAETGCPPRWLSYGKRCYIVKEDKVLYDTAVKKCHGARAEVALLKDRKYLREFIKSQIQHSHGTTFWTKKSSSYVSQRYTYQLSKQTIYYQLKVGSRTTDLLSSNHFSSLQKTPAGYICERNQGRVYPPNAVIHKGCPPNGYAYENKCYVLYHIAYPWSEAKRICEDRNGTLASIPNLAVLDFINAEFTWHQQHFHIGLSKNEDNEYTWQSGEKVTYIPWSNDFDGTQREACVELRDTEDGTFFFPVDCESKQLSLCEFPRQGDEDYDLQGSEVKLNDCFDAWTEHGDFCYKHFTEKKTWIDAQKFCEQVNGDLMSIHTKDTQQLLQSFEDTSLWLGLHKENRTQGYKWSDGSPLNYIQWSNPLHAYRDEELCAGAESKSRNWNHFKCNQKNNYICQVWRGVPQPKMGCPPSWLPYEKHCFLVQNVTGSYSTAEDECKQAGAELVDLRGRQYTTDFLSSQLHHSPRTRFWAKKYTRLVYGLQGVLTNLYYKYYDETDYYQLQFGEANLKTSKYESHLPKAGYICERGKEIKFEPKILSTPQTMSAPVDDVIHKGCPVNGYAYENKCYVLDRVAYPWSEAKRICQDRNGTLASIPNLAVLEFINAEFIRHEKHIHIGLSRNEDNEYTWQNGEKATYTPWSNDFDGTEEETCVELHGTEDGPVFSPVDCESKQAFVCEVPREGYEDYDPQGSKVIFNNCSDAWTEHGDFCYKHFKEKKNWTDAQTDCEEMNGDLMSIHSPDTQQLLKSFEDLSIWIGLHKKNENTSYEWSDESPFNYIHWSDSIFKYQMDELCVVADANSGRWNVELCYDKFVYICQVWRGQYLDGTVTESPADSHVTIESQQEVTVAETTAKVIQDLTTEDGFRGETPYVTTESQQEVTVPPLIGTAAETTAKVIQDLTTEDGSLGETPSGADMLSGVNPSSSESLLKTTESNPTTPKPNIITSELHPSTPDTSLHVMDEQPKKHLESSTVFGDKDDTEQTVEEERTDKENTEKDTSLSPSTAIPHEQITIILLSSTLLIAVAAVAFLYVIRNYRKRRSLMVTKAVTYNHRSNGGEGTGFSAEENRTDPPFGTDYPTVSPVSFQGIRDEADYPSNGQVHDVHSEPSLGFENRLYEIHP